MARVKHTAYVFNRRGRKVGFFRIRRLNSGKHTCIFEPLVYRMRCMQMIDKDTRDYIFTRIKQFDDANQDFD
jgi:hypothetical protein